MNDQAWKPYIIDRGIRDWLWIKWRQIKHMKFEGPSCRKCGYCVLGLSRPICPECGADLPVSGVIDPNLSQLWSWPIIFIVLITMSIYSAALFSWPIIEKHLISKEYFPNGSNYYNEYEIISGNPLPSTSNIPKTKSIFEYTHVGYVKTWFQSHNTQKWVNSSQPEIAVRISRYDRKKRNPFKNVEQNNKIPDKYLNDPDLPPYVELFINPDTLLYTGKFYNNKNQSIDLKGNLSPHENLLPLFEMVGMKRDDPGVYAASQDFLVELLIISYMDIFRDESFRNWERYNEAQSQLPAWIKLDRGGLYKVGFSRSGAIYHQSNIWKYPVYSLFALIWFVLVWSILRYHRSASNLLKTGL